MAPSAEPLPLERRALYTVAPDPPHGWRVTGRRGRRGRGGFPSRAAAEAHAERLAAGHLVAQVRVFGADGSLERDERVADESRCWEAQRWLESYLSHLGDYQRVRARLVDEWYVENRLVEVAGEVVWLYVGIHEGQAWDEIHVHAALGDEAGGPRLAEAAFTLWGF